MLGVECVGKFVEDVLGCIVCLLYVDGVCCFVVVGGEILGVVVQVFDVCVFCIGLQIDLGVFWMVIIDIDLVVLVLKFGNFGMVDFFEKVLV